MDYEKKYKEALETARQINSGEGVAAPPDWTIYEVIFPELKESEDERIRNKLITYFRDLKKGWFGGINSDDVIAWLEKQGQSKPTIPYKAIREGVAHFGITQYQIDNWLKKYVCVEGEEQSIFDQYKQEGDKITTNPDGTHFNLSQLERVAKVEPKFKVGDWVMLDRPVLITKVEDMPYNTHQYWTSDGTWFGDGTKAKLWTIQDAKDGDVLKYKGCTFIFKKTEPSDIVTNIKNPLTVLGYCGINHIGFEKTNGWGDTANCKYHPATKEQRELLFQKMHEAGYEWDAEKKELKEIKKISKWTEEDDVRRRSTIQILEYARCLNTYNLYGKATIDKNIAWLEKQALKAKPKWSDEMKFKKFDIITNGKIEYEIKDIQKNQLGDWVYILYNDSVARLLPNDSHLPDGSIKWVCEQVDEQFELKQRMEEQQ